MKSIINNDVYIESQKMKKSWHTNTKQKKSNINILISGFRIKNKETGIKKHCKIIKWSIYKEQTILLKCAANNRDSRSKRKKLVKLKEKR